MQKTRLKITMDGKMTSLNRCLVMGKKGGVL